ncbi:thiamine ABC transporter substrate-binding protein [Nocardioides daeguensis]|uniref:Thiamine ABC transporter substrate-binding protein n=1 Tax=Nocardioides daeguensis TaxID=908359 RepID=A0ABP6USS5_9ACTN|nr:thiamine ABC transporter substrate-binding protein [Nocardioides daeguensis]MBV6728639.1 thiamine ABC transporter substrate-binding protein [Nocardioides daeguensis]MCR1773752.1 thiamine ABC transporter substrate-binding protein [Nocardioides daeguensis]
MRMRTLTGRTLVALSTTALLASSCSLIGSESDSKEGGDTTVTLVTHESFNLPKDLVTAFEKDTGYRLEISKLEDAGALTNELVLTKDKPVGDVVFGVDNTFATRAIDEGVFAPYAPSLPQGADAYELDGDDDDALTPVDTGNVCVNIDDAWFAAKGVPAPTSLDDLTKPAYKDLFVIPGASTSSPGLAFLLATIAKYGADWSSYWTRLVDNGAKVVKGWSDAYFTDFTFSGGDRPIVVSYDSSPAFTLNKSGDETTTSALLDGCFEQVEYAGVLRGETTNTDGARAVIDWLLSPQVQAALPESMYVFPVATDVELPADWAKFAERPETTEQVAPSEIAKERKAWLEQWTEIVSR